jgi:hypothetical protein
MQANETVNDYRKWLAFNSSLSNHQNVSDLYQAVKEKRTIGIYSAEISYNEQGNQYRITDTNYSALEISESEVSNFLTYINKHYITTPADIRLDNINKVVSTIPKGASPFAHVDGLSESQTGNFLINENIVLHAIGYVIIGILIGQVFVLPQFLNVKLPEYFKWIFFVLFAVLCHVAVRNYKKNFLTGGIRYRVVAKLTVTIFGLAFAGFAFEIIVFDLFSKGENLDLIAVAVTGIAMIVAGLFSGWIVSLFIFFSNGGKVVTDPTTIKQRHEA